MRAILRQALDGEVGLARGGLDGGQARTGRLSVLVNGASAAVALPTAILGTREP